MKSFGRFLLVCGIVLSITGVLGFFFVNSSGVSGGFVDAAIGLNYMLGSTQYMSSGERLLLKIIQFRTTLFMSGLVAVVIGYIAMKSNN